VVAIAQDVETKAVLMVAWMNAETLGMTLEQGRMVYWSRSRREIWRKGDTSGDRQFVREAYYDCDADALLFLVEQEGKGACHTGAYSRFYRRFGE
jgi:phosphoribosyl-AMP cyclohydrolase/phosphoribosyl-ATP pyrophosphohydrolase/phosphoribosyl-AMP cyclohydrolase